MKEITAVLHKHAITRGVSPEKLRMILEDLGPTYIKLGQIMSLRSDILPKRYCDELMKLCSDVAPMPFEQVVDVIQDAFGCPWQEEFQSIEEKPLGSASIAQVHRAVMKTGEQVVIKVQRKGIYRTMARDIGLMHKVVRLLPPVSIKEMVDLDLVLDELWKVTQEEMNFLTEAANMEEFHRKNREVAFVDTPVLYREYTTPHVIVMEYIDGFSIDDKENLLKNGYDLNEVGSKLIDNFIKQVMVDGFFHADPHPGNLRVRDGKIVWIDMGMMGRLSEHDREEIGRAIEGIALNDIGIMQDLMEVMKENKITMPHGLTMLARGLTHIEGVLADISPEISMMEIASARVKSQMFEEMDWKKELKSGGKILYRSLRKAIDIPTLLADILQGQMKGQTRVNLDLHAGEDVSNLLRRVTRNIVMGLWVMALLISSSIICTTDMKPKLLGIPALGAFGYFIAVIIVFYVFAKHIFSKRK